MSWPMASFLVLALALAAGFAWYERSHPSARVLALVASMAALAALGRVAFAPLPNVKPTTDIVLISGFALGGAPGFAVGALAALSSNIFFGQGPWTPWQMAAWGGVGIAGALLARVLRRRPGRLVLAAACALAGLAFGVVMNFSTFVTFTGDHTFAEFAAIAASALPFDLVHAVGNIAFALLFGPALVGMLQRFRDRFEVDWRPAPRAASSPAATTMLVAVLAAGALFAGALRPAESGAATPATYLRAAQNSDGGFGAAPRQRSSQLYTGWAALGLAAAGQNPLDVRRPGGRTPVDSMRANAGLLNDTGELERTIMVLSAAGVSPRTFAGRDLVLTLDRRRRADGSFGGLVNLTAFAVMALRSTGRPTTAPSIRLAANWVARQQNPDGGFNFGGRGGPSGIDDTAAAIQGLAAAGRPYSIGVRRAVAFLAARQNLDGGFGLVPGGPSNAQSSAFAVQAMIAARRNPDLLHRSGARSPLSYLRSLTMASGLVRYSRTSAQTPVWVTAQAQAALSRRPFPIGRVRRAAAPRALATAAAATAHNAGAKRTGPGTESSSGTASASPMALRAAHDVGLLAGWLLAPVL